MRTSLSFFSAGMPNGWKRSPCRRARTTRGGLRLSRSSATRHGSAPKARGSNLAGRERVRAVTEPPPGSATLPGSGRGTHPRPADAGADDERCRTRPAPSLLQVTPPGTSQERAPLPAARSASTWRLEKSAGRRATVRNAVSSARERIAGCVEASIPGVKAYRWSPAAAVSSSLADWISILSLSCCSISASFPSRSTMRGLYSLAMSGSRSSRTRFRR